MANKKNSKKMFQIRPVEDPKSAQIKNAVKRKSTVIIKQLDDLKP